MIVEDGFDPLLYAQKHVMLKNGLFEFEDIPNAKCYCGHCQSEHLDCVELCLFAKGKKLCICDRFLEQGSKVNISKKDVLQKVLGTGI
jgi:hypothetical protein